MANSIRQLPGIGGLALSLALQTTLSNFIGGGVLMPKDGVQRLGKRSSSEQ